MTALAEALLDGLNENAVDFRDNYDGTLQEPVVLPASFPNLLANGASGMRWVWRQTFRPITSRNCAMPVCI